MPHDVFLCYSARDQGTADTVCHGLEAQGIRCWMAARDITPGQNWGGAIVDAIVRSRVFVIIFSAEANRSQQVLREVERAANRHIPIIPFRIEDLVPVADLEYYLSATHWLDAFTPPIEAHVSRLARSVQRLLDGKPQPRPGTHAATYKDILGTGAAEAQEPARPAPITVQRHRKRSRRWLVVPATATLLAAAVLGGRLLRDRTAGDRTAAAGAQSPTLAVLPFVNMSNDSANEYFSDGITEEILNALTHVDDLRVAARTSSFAYKGRNYDVRKVAAQLGVQMVLEGSVRKAGNDVRISAQLVEAAHGYQIWSQTYDRQLDQVFGVQEEIARSIADALQVRMSRAARNTLARQSTSKPEAFDLYLRGRHLISFTSQERNEKAIDYLQRAVAADPEFAPAHAALAIAYIRMGEFTPARTLLPRAKAAALRALELDSTLVETRLALSDVRQVYDRDWSAAEQEIRRALRLDPGSSAAHFTYALFLLDARRFEDAEVERRRAWELRRTEATDTTLPAFRLQVLNSWAGFYLHIANYPRALEYARAALELDPADQSARWVLAMVYHDTGRHQQAVAELERIQRESANPQPYLTHLARAYASAGRRAEARAILDTLHARARHRYVPKDQIALIHYALGDTTQALDWLNRAIDDYHWWMPSTNGHVLWRGLWSNPRFGELMRKLGAPAN